MRDKSRPRLPSGKKPGVINEFTTYIKLVMRLLADRRVNILLKLLPIGSVLYLFMPDLAPGPIDDALLIWLGTTLFVELCPEDIVREHREALASVVEGEWREIEDDTSTSE
ncbi:MAG: hypothetical protein PVI78_03335 [Anaerolineales bacterium]|jgi:hypothetical protein